MSLGTMLSRFCRYMVCSLRILLCEKDFALDSSEAGSRLDYLV
jgi:hypothetical protein